MIPVYTVCTGPNYFPHHVNRFLEQLKTHVNLPLRLHCYTTYSGSEFDRSIEILPIQNDDGRRQWHKVDFFKIAPKDQVCFVSDLDWTFIGDVTDIFNIPVNKNEFIAPYRWWTRYKGTGFTINGGLYKFIGGQYTFIPEVFHSNPEYWMRRYIVDLKLAHPPVNGEQNFVDEMLQRHGVDIKYFQPAKAFGRKPVDIWHAVEYNQLYADAFKEDMYWLGTDINPNLRMVQSILDMTQLHALDLYQ